MHCTNFEKNAGTHLHDTHRAVEEPSTASMADIGNSLSVPRANAFHMAKQSHQIRNLNVFERMHGIFDLAAEWSLPWRPIRIPLAELSNC
jgi:hypothetical protein